MKPDRPVPPSNYKLSPQLQERLEEDKQKIAAMKRFHRRFPCFDVSMGEQCPCANKPELGLDCPWSKPHEYS